MQQFHDELESVKAGINKLRSRRWELRTLIFWHYAVILLALAITLLVGYTVVLTDSQYKGQLLVADMVMAGIALYLLLSGVKAS